MEVSNSEYSSEFDHTPFYCEENVYLLCKKLCAKGVADADGSDLFVVFISNEKKQAYPTVASKGKQESRWYYSLGLSCCLHSGESLIYFARKRDGDSSCLVWDLDSSLPFPSPLASYVSETIRPSFPVFSEFQRFFRMVHAPIFLRFFASDRRHMKDPAGNWIAEPPSYEPIVAEDKTVHNLNEYIEIRAEEITTNVGADLITAVFNNKLGVVMNENQLEEFFSQVSQ
ncbi:hypothetical protein JRO89_XS11G0076400 [Xanthoceras sorbifolium]|uniref:Protein N-terminal glutamine amidohydrolase n=1 Tax=Xanthoceras sorbifolium TaxID=99658 RepID=A0ABQ8HF29_9ROSI|nr:hypothetical protein JRO89_XS11G0076400 [Xanthoceras sorbifolium]